MGYGNNLSELPVWMQILIIVFIAIVVCIVFYWGVVQHTLHI